MNLLKVRLLFRLISSYEIESTRKVLVSKNTIIAFENSFAFRQLNKIKLKRKFESYVHIFHFVLIDIFKAYFRHCQHWLTNRHRDI
jgi:hypothetical protein